MQILLVGRDTSVTNTIKQMLESVDQWTVTNRTTWEITEAAPSPEGAENSYLDIIIANLADFTESSVRIIKEITSYFADVPVLVLYSYDQQAFIDPLIKAGATGYLQNGNSEDDLLEAVKAVAAGEQYVSTKSTY